MGGGTPVVVQGTAVAQPYNPYEHKAATPTDQAPTTSAAATSTQGGEKQPVKCRDPIFALLLYGNVGAIAAVAAIYGSKAFEGVNEGGYNYNGYIYAAFILGIIAMVFTGFCLPIMMCIPEVLIKVSLIGMLLLSGVMMVISFISGNFIGGIFGVIFFLIFACYTRAVWSRIPFASVNLLTACTAVKKNCGVIFVAYVFVIIAFAWSILWSIALAGVYDQVILTPNGQESSINYGYYFLLFLSFFFTHQVIQNSTHVTVSGTVGSWWFSPADSGCCSGGVMGSTIRTLTTSFGSICFGSLLVAILQALKAVASAARSEEGGSFLICIAECIIQCLANIMEYFNKWAFVYVGLYGYSYIEAGKNVFTLFKNRGWEAIIADDLVQNVFFFLSLSVGGVCAGIGYAFNENTGGDWFSNAPNTGLSVQATNAILGFIIGLVLSSILLSTIGSAVNAVIVCFAEGPAEFEVNHPELSRKMRETWLQFYPNSGV